MLGHHIKSVLQHITSALGLIVISLGTSCGGSNSAMPQSNKLALINGRIYTVSDVLPWAEAILINQGMIEAIGTDEDIKTLLNDNVEVINLNGRMVMPGIHDVHMHPLEAASDNFQFILDTNESDPENYRDDVTQAIDQNPNSQWILGWGFDIYTLLDAARPPIDILDELSTDQAIAIMEQTSHSVWVNSKALELAGISNDSPNPAGGIIMKDPEGTPNGILIDNAGNLIIDLAIASIPDNELNDYDGLVQFALPELAKHGITSICDARTYWKRNHHETWQQVEDDGKLTARVSLGLWLYPTEDPQTQIDKLKSLYSFDQNSFLKINQIKLYADGIIVNTTSAMHEDFLINIFGLPTNNGLNYLSESAISEYIAALEPTGFDFHIHAIGNRGVHEALNAIATNSGGNGRHRITHVEYVDEIDLPRFSELDVTADAQVAGEFSQPANWRENNELVGPQLNQAIIPLKSLLDSNARLTLSSDWDVSTLNPFVGMEHAITREPQELSLEEAIRAYTINAAYVMRQEHLVGTLEVGKAADFIILDRNIFEIPKLNISSTQVLSTYLEGELIYQR